jgi:hypothetical protein
MSRRLVQLKIKPGELTTVRHGQSATTDDMKVEHYSMVTGKSLR